MFTTILGCTQVYGSIPILWKKLVLGEDPVLFEVDKRFGFCSTLETYHNSGMHPVERVLCPAR